MILDHFTQMLSVRRIVTAHCSDTPQASPRHVPDDFFVDFGSLPTCYGCAGKLIVCAQRILRRRRRPTSHDGNSLAICRVAPVDGPFGMISNAAIAVNRMPIASAKSSFVLDVAFEAVAAVESAAKAKQSGAPCRNSPIPVITSLAICTKSLPFHLSHR
jgi:hypothetical protein